MNWLFAYLNINKRKVRLGRSVTPRYLIGFKFHCLGRFTRRQRASSKWVDAYKMPLNTLSAFIDYGFFTIPLRNSAIAVKVWLYKDKNYNDYYLKVT
jgi:ribosomal protein S3